MNYRYSPESMLDFPADSQSFHLFFHIDISDCFPGWSRDVHGDKLSDEISKVTTGDNDGVFSNLQRFFRDLLERFAADESVLSVQLLLHHFNLKM